MTTTETPDLITYEIARERIEAVASERPDYVNAVPRFAEDGETVIDYAPCIYFNEDGSPSCIVGTALAVELVEAGINCGTSTNEGGIYTLIQSGIRLTPRAAYFLQAVQGAQDEGATWREAFTRGVEKTDRRTADEDLNEVRPLHDDRAARGTDY